MPPPQTSPSQSASRSPHPPVPPLTLSWLLVGILLTECGVHGARGFIVPWAGVGVGRGGRGSGAGVGESPIARALATKLQARSAQNPSQSPLPIETHLTATELIEHFGYPAEEHSIQTEDGYILALHRIPYGRDVPSSGGRSSDSSSRPVVFMQHGLLQSADQWILRGPGKDLAFILADLGYDVWMGNFRGNTYSRRHVSLSPDTDQFWDFSWHESGYYDLPASIDYALAVSGQPALFFIGHSMGTTAALVLLSTRPEYNHRIRTLSLLAPVVYFTYPRGALGMALPLWSKAESELRRVRQELLPRSSLQRAIASSLCREDSPSRALCDSLYFHIAGQDSKQFNQTLFTIILGHLPSGSSFGQFAHYAQTYKSGQFRQFDHGIRGNVLKYGTQQPPKYNLRNVVTPVMFHYSSGDYCSNAHDVERAAQEIPGTVGLFKVPWKDFNHGDYMWANDSYELLYKTVVKLLRQF